MTDEQDKPTDRELYERGRAEFKAILEKAFAIAKGHVSSAPPSLADLKIEDLVDAVYVLHDAHKGALEGFLNLLDAGGGIPGESPLVMVRRLVAERDAALGVAPDQLAEGEVG